MNLIALLIGLAIERLATRIFHWRRMRWMDRIIDAGFRRAASLENWPALIPVMLLTVLLALPVALVMLVLGDSFLGFPYLALSVVVLFFSLGPADIGEDVDEYCAALREGDEERIQQTARALVEGDVRDDDEERMEQVESAVFVQANNRLYAVIFWFVALGPLGLFGPLGAWTYRVTDLIRRRAVFNAAREDEARYSQASDDETGDESDDETGDAAAGAELQSSSSGRLCEAAILLHGWLAWIPARLTAIGYAIAGHFDAALHAWRAPQEHSPASTSEGSEQLLARVGVGALALHDEDGESLTERAVRGATAANRLVFRLLLIWAVIIAALTLYGWSL